MIWKYTYKIVDYFRKTCAAKVYKKIMESQWWSKEKLDKYQFDLLKKLLIHCNSNVPYYQELFRQNSFNPVTMSDIKEIEKIPIITKDIIRKNFENIKAVNFSSFIPRPKITGGSTGQPITVYNDFLSHSYLAANNLRVWNAATDYKIGDKFITIAHGSLLPNKITLKNKFYFLFQNSTLISSYHLNKERLTEAIAIINKSRAKFIYGYSSSIFMLAKFASTNNIDISSKLQAIYTTSDMLYSNQRELIESTFKVPVFDSYGCPESGIISFECEYHNGYHLNQESSYVEIINHNNEGLGKIIATPLHNYAFPLIRYDTGDVGKYSHEKCECGRYLPKISELGGRIRDFVILKDGRYIHGAFFNHFAPFYENTWIDEYQIIQKEIDSLLIKISTRRTPTQQDLDIIVSELRKGLLQDLKIEFDLNGVEYTSGGKFRLIISQVKTEWEK
jgi:phenylacetate-CoA ligase